MMKLLKMTHNIRRGKINSSTLSTVAIKDEFPFFDHRKWVCKVHVYDIIHHALIKHSLSGYTLIEQSFIVLSIFTWLNATHSIVATLE